MPGTTTESRDLRVIWQDAESRQFHEVGTLHIQAGDERSRFQFEYADLLPPSFHPFLAFPDPSRVYESDDLFPFFSNRIMSAEREDYDDHLRALGLSEGDATPFEMLSRTSGRRTTDTVQVVPALRQDSDGVIRQRFLVSGIRYQPDPEATLGALEEGELLQLQDDPENERNPHAILLNAATGATVGYVPDYLLDDVRKLREERQLRMVVERVNGPHLPWHLRLLCRLEALPGR